MISFSDNIKYVLIFKNKIFPYFEHNKKSNVDFYIVRGNKLIVNQFKVKKAIKIIDPDIVYFPAFPPSLLLSKSKKRKIIIMIHDLVAWDCPKTMKFKSKLLFKFGIKHGLRISDVITTNSLFTKKRIIDKFSTKKPIIVVPCGADEKASNISFDTIKNELMLPDNYFLALGTLEPRKNFVGLLQYYQKACEIYELPKLVIVGRKGWKTDDILDKFENIKSKIIFTGFVKDEYLTEIYSNSIAFIFSSIYEGFGIPVLEAVTYNSIPIVSRIPTNIELLGNDYKYVFDFNEESFCKIISSFMNASNKSKDILISNLKDRIKKYSWKNNAIELYNVINNIK